MSTQPSAYTTVAASAEVPWYRTITAEQWRVLLAAKFGWMLDAMDFMLYAMAIGQLRAYFGINDATAGLLGTVTLAMSAFGGIVFGFVADRFGRTRALMATIMIFSLASLGVDPAPRLKVVKLEAPPQRQKGVIVKDAAELVAALKQKGLV